MGNALLVFPVLESQLMKLSLTRSHSHTRSDLIVLLPMPLNLVFVVGALLPQQHGPLHMSTRDGCMLLDTGTVCMI